MKSTKNKIILGSFILFLGIVGFLCVKLTGRGVTEETMQKIDEPVANLKMLVMGKQPAEGMEELYAQLDALTIPDLGCTVRFEFVPWGNERKQLNILTASGEYDLIPGGNFSDYQILAAKNAFLDLNEYLHLVPELVEHYSYYGDAYLEDNEIGGGLYGIPQYGAGGLNYDSEGFFYREDLRRKWGLPEITNLETMEAYLYYAKQTEEYRNEPLITDNRIWQSLWILVSQGRYVEVRSMQETPFVVVDASQPNVVLNRLETPEFQRVLEYIYKWRCDGILETDMLSLSDNEGERGLELMLANKKPCETNVPIWSVNASFIPALIEQHPDWEYGFFNYIETYPTYYISSNKSGSVVSVSAKTKYPELAVKLLSKIHTDQQYYNLFRYGVEGIHYYKTVDMISFEEVDSENRFGMAVIGDDLMSYQEVPINTKWGDVMQRVDQWREDTVLKAELHPLDNFSFLTTGLEKELEKMENARLKYFQPLICGHFESLEDCKQAIVRLQIAGLNVYIESIQRQLEEYLQ